MYKRLLFLGVLPLLLFNCKKVRTFEKNENSIIFVDEDFRVVNKLKAIELEELTDSLFFTVSLIINNDYMFVNEFKSSNYIHAIEIPSDTYVGKYGDIGKGPGEILAPWRLSKSEKGELRIFDLIQKKIVEFDIDSLLNNNKHNREYRIPIGSSTYSAIIYEDRLFYLDLNNTKHRVFEKGINDSIIVGHGTLPKMELRISDFDHAKMNTVNMNNYKGLFAFSYNSFPLVEIFDTGKDKWISIIGPENYLPSSKEYQNRTLYNTVKISDNYVYALYNGKEYKGHTEAELAEIIYVFSHSGELIKKLILDKSVISFDIYKDQYIYAITNEDELFKILKFEL